MDDFKEKDKIIGRIRRHHPARCPDEFSDWAHYRGGMVDSGGWHYEAMLRSPLSELKCCHRALQKSKQDVVFITKP